MVKSTSFKIEQARVRVNSSFSADGRADEVFVTSDKPNLNVKFNLDGESAAALETGFYNVTFERVEEKVVPGPELVMVEKKSLVGSST